MLQLFHKFKTSNDIDFAFADAKLAVMINDGSIEYIDIAGPGDVFIWIEKSRAAGAKFAFAKKDAGLARAKLKFYGLNSVQVDIE